MKNVQFLLIQSHLFQQRTNSSHREQIVMIFLIIFHFLSLFLSSDCKIISRAIKWRWLEMRIEFGIHENSTGTKHALLWRLSICYKPKQYKEYILAVFALREIQLSCIGCNVPRYDHDSICGHDALTSTR